MTLIGPEYEEQNPVYVPNAFDTFTGDVAAEAVAKDNDSEYVTPGLGVVKVPRERWLNSSNARGRTKSARLRCWLGCISLEKKSVVTSVLNVFGTTKATNLGNTDSAQKPIRWRCMNVTL